MPQNNNSVDRKPTTFSTKAIRLAIQTLEPMLGRAVVEAVINDLEMHGLQLTNGDVQYSLAEIQIAFEKIFEKEVVELLIDRVSKELLKKSQ